MSLSASAGYLADLSGLAARCAVCFCAARAAGADVKAIGPSARAAAILGAELPELHASVPAYEQDTLYLAECESIRIAIARHARAVQDLQREAEGWREWAAREMLRATRDMDMPRYYHALQAWHDADHALSVCHETLTRLDKADRALVLAPVRYADVYEEPVTFVAKGGLLPYEGRWISGEKPKPTVRWLGGA